MRLLVSIAGPTASGKTAASLKLAKEFNAPIISADSVQIYRGLDIGSGKITDEEREEVPHFMIDIVDPIVVYSAGMYGRAVDALLEKLFEKHEVVILAGGAGFYLDAVWNGMDDMPQVSPGIRAALNESFAQDGLAPLLAELKAVDPVTFEEVDRQNPVRIIRALEVYRSSGKPISFYRGQRPEKAKSYQDMKLGLSVERPILYDRINRRVDGMLSHGLVEEVQRLQAAWGADAKALQSVGYAELVRHFAGDWDFEEAVRLIKRNSRRYAKRQMTWLRRQPDLNWTESGAHEAMEKIIFQALKSNPD